MSEPYTKYRHSELLHRLVLDRTTAEEFGKVEVVWMQPETHQVMGIVSKTSLLSKKRFAFKLSQLLTIGAEGIVVNSLPVETDTEYVGVLETLIGHELWSDSGNRLGHITDCLFQLETGEITDYLFRSQGWQGYIDRVYRLPTRGIVQMGKKRVLVAERAVPLIAAYQDGLEQKVSKVTEDLQEDLQSLSETAQSATKRAGQQVRAIAEQATQKAKAVREEFPSQEALNVGRSLLEQLQERAQSVGKDLKKELSPLAQQLKQSIQHSPAPKPPQAPPPKSQKDWETELENIPQKDLEDDEPWI
jgi:uncharacterized protein YrrD